jgi:mRNA interferase RelE/StbE
LSYTIEFKPSVRGDVAKLPRELLERIDKKILGLAQNPHPTGSKKLTGSDGLYRVRVGDY